MFPIEFVRWQCMEKGMGKTGGSASTLAIEFAGKETSGESFCCTHSVIPGIFNTKNYTKPSCLFSLTNHHLKEI